MHSDHCSLCSWDALGMGIGLVCTEKVEKEHEAGTDGEAQTEVSGCGL